jgi:hypothetical protein
VRLHLAALAAAATMLAAACASGPSPITYTVMPTSLTPIESDHNKAKDFARIFCSTLGHFTDLDGRSWGDCAKYIEVAQPPQAQTSFTAPFRFLFVAGFGNDCLQDVRAFGPSIEHLKNDHDVAVEAFGVPPYASSEENGKAIAKHIDDGWTADQTRKYVLIGYDKGAADLIDALRVLDNAPSKVAGLVTIAGLVGGVWRPQEMSALLQPGEPWISSSCPGNVPDGIASLGREVRQSVLRATHLDVPRYSLVAASDYADTSDVLRPMWKQLSLFAREQDGVVVAWESVLPDAKFLGTLRGDHWAVALPFDDSGQAFKKITRNRFPRDAVFEAVVRFVAADLPAGGPAAAPK